MKIYSVIWSSAAYDWEENIVKALNGSHGTFKSKKSARKALEESKLSFIDEICHDPEYDDDELFEIKESLQVYGSLEEDYFELDYTFADAPVEIHIQIVETELAE